MTATALDTHKTVKRLRDAGFNEAQAETMTEIIASTREIDLSHLATKADLAELRAATKADFAGFKAEAKADLTEFKTATKADFTNFKAETKADLAELKADLFKWLVPLLIGQAALIAAMVRLL